MLATVKARPEVAFAAAFLVAITGFYGVFAYTNYAGAEGLRDNDGLLIGRDFVVFWTASVLALKGQVSEIFDLLAFHRLQEQLMGTEVPYYPWLYPPHGLLPILPLGLLPYLWSYVLWSLLTLGLYLLAVLRRPWADHRSLALVLAPATFINLVMGQNGFLTAALMIGGFRLLDRYPLCAGVLLGLLSFKPQLGLLVPVALVAARLWRPFIAAAVTVVLMVALSAAAFGPDSWQAFFETSTGNQARHLNDTRGWFLNIVATPFTSASLLGLDTGARLVIQGLFSLAAVTGVYAAFRGSAERELQVAVLLVGVFLASPYGYHYDMTVVSVAVLWAFGHALKSGFLPGERLVMGLVWVLPILIVAANPAGLPVAPPLLAAFFALLVYRATRRPFPSYAPARPPGALEPS